MKTRMLVVTAVVVIALTGGTAWANFSSVVQQGSSFVATYTANIPNTLNGNDVTNVMIFEKDSGGDVRVVAFPNTLAPGGVSVLSDTLSFSPTSTFIVGLDLLQPSDLTGKRHLVMFVNDAFASSAAGKDFSQAFPPLHEQAFIDNLLAAYGGVSSSQSLVQSYFASGPLDSAAFTPGGSFTVVESSVITPPVPIPAAAWLLGSGLLSLAGLGRRRSRKS